MKNNNNKKKQEAVLQQNLLAVESEHRRSRRLKRYRAPRCRPRRFIKNELGLRGRGGGGDNLSKPHTVYGLLKLK